MRLITALLAATLAIPAQGMAQILPFGEFAARDGRPGPGKSWKLNDTQGQALAARMNAVAAKTPIVVDYDHQTITAPTTGAKAPAAGWISKVTWLNGQGLFAEVDWTAAAHELIGAQEYKYFSPVIEYDESTLEIRSVLMGALVNFPGILGMAAVEAALATQFLKPAAHLAGNTPNDLEQHRMNPTLLALLAALGLANTATETEALSAVAALKTAADAAKTQPAIPAALATELGVPATADLPTAVAALSGLKTRAAAAAGGVNEAALAQIAALQGQLQTLQAAQTDRQVTELADAAIAAGKFVPAFRDELVKIGKANLATLSGMVAAAPVIPGLQGQATAGAAAAADAAANTATAALSSAEALQVAANMGIKPDAWTAALPKKAA